MTEIRFEKVTKKFNDLTIIKGLDLTIHEGEFFTFVGPSGCGKSTILNMIAGLEPPTEGSIFFDGRTVNDLSPKERDVAMVFQSYALYPHMTVYDNIAFPLRMKKVRNDDIDSEVNRVASLLALGDFLGKKPKELSGGQRQRVALGRAIVRKPKVFLMDEPLSNIDARLRIEMRGELKKLHQELGITTVYVTHDQAEAMGLSDRIAVQNNGSIQQCDTPREVYRNPANIFVAGFIGSPPMNFFPCHVRKSLPLEIACNGMVLRPILGDAPEADNIIIGMRPEDISISGQRSEGDWEVSVALTETAGPFTWVVCQWRDVELRGVSGTNEELKAGSTAFMRFSPDKAVVFNKESGKRLNQRGDPGETRS
jgi:multiple sugar transport system ATP-binding protein